MRATKYAALALLLSLSLTLLLHGNLAQVSSGTWTPANNLAEARSGSAAVILDDGGVLFTGGTGSTGPLTSAELFNTGGSISVAAPMLDPRTHHTVTVLKDGRVLVAGGTTFGGGTTSAAEIYDPAGNSWTAVPGGMTSPRSSHTASLLSDGRVLLAGGATTAGATNTLEIFSPATGSFTAVTAGMLSSVRQEHAAAVLADGRVLIAGGSDGATSLNSTDIFDPATDSVAAGPAMASARAGLSATTLLDGRVLLAGGNSGSADLSTAEVYNASTGSISATGGLATPRRDHLALLLPHNNGVLITGGSSAGAPLASTELFYPWTGAFTATGAMASPRTAAAGAALKQDGYLLVAGGSDGTNPLAGTELYGFATVKTDKADYAPGEIVNISGTGWQPGETVTLTFVESPLLDTHGPFSAVADSFGNIANIDFVPDDHDIGILFYLTATGSVSQAQTTFADSKPNTVTVGPQSPNPAAPGSSTTYTVTVNFNGNGNSCTSPLSVSTALPAGVTASFSPSSLTSTGGNVDSTLTLSTTNATPPGSTTFTVLAANGGGTCQAGTATNTGTLVVVEPTTTTLTSSVNPSTFGQSATLTATVTQTAGTTTPTGTVTFKDGATTLGTGTLNGSGVATFTTTALSVAGSPHSLTASYAGVTNTFGASNSNTVSQTVNKSGTTTTVALTTGTNPSVFGQSLTFTATVAAVAPGAGTPPGTVTFKDGATTLAANVALDLTGKATLTTTTFAVGSHSITAVYNADTNFNGSTSSALAHTVNQASTSTTLTSSANPSVFGQSVTFTATVAAVAPGAGTPTGAITFKDGINMIGTGTLNGAGVATFSTSSLSVATHPITAVYGSDNSFSGSTSAVLNQVVNKANTSTVVTSSVNPSTYGQSVTLTATVTVVAPGAGTLTGSAQFFDGATSLGAGTAINGSGVATITTSALSAGSHNAITAVFTSGDGNFNGNTSPVFSQSVSMADSTTTVVSSLNPSQFGQSVTFTATVTYGSPAVLAASGCVTFMDNTSGATLASNVLLASGQATFTTSSLTAGSHDIQANFKDQGAGCNADNNLQNSHGNVTQVVNKADTTTAVTSSLNPSVFGQSVTFTATVSPVAPATATPTGTVTFKDGATVLGSGPLNGSGVATFSTSTLSVASHPITAVYGGSNSYNTSTSTLLSQVVNQASTSTAVTSSVNPSTFGQSVTFTATVTAVAPGAGIPGGTVTFMDGASTLGPGTLNASGVATFSASALSVSASPHSITSVYGGNTNFSGSTSPAISQVVNPASTTTTVTSSLNPSNYGQSVTFTATVTSLGTPTGTVDFKDGATTIGTGTLSGGTATFSTSALAVGTHSITAVYGANGNFAGSTSSALSQVVNAVATSTSIVSSPDPSFLGQSVTFTATVTPAAATGTVNFFDGPTLLGSGALVAGNATYTTTALTLGSHSITAVYLGDGNFTGSTSAILTQVVKSAVTTTTVESSVNPSTFGTLVTFTATVTPQDASAGTPSGNLTFYEGGDCTSLGIPLQAGTLDGAGKATYSTSSFSAGAHIVVACYAGNTTFNSSGGSATQNVTQATTTTTLASSNASSTLGQLVTFTATVSSTSGTPGGNVYIYDGTTLIGGGTLSAAATSFSTAVLSAGAGPHSLTAAYGGNTSFSPSNSSAISQTVGPRGTMTVVDLSPVTVPIGQASTATLTVTDKREYGPTGTPGVFTALSPTLAVGRSGHTATRLPNGMVMVIGGHGSGAITQVELCDPDTGNCNAPPTFTATARTGHTATLLNNGKVLIVGGSSTELATGAMNSVELFDPLMGTFSLGTSLGTARFMHTAILLPDGKVLIAGGQNSSGTALNTTEVYDPAGATWSAGGPLMTARAGHAAAMLPNGKVLITGGGTSSAELYTPGSGSIATVGSMSTDRTGHTATLLPDGNVLIAGGASSGPPMDNTELYNAAADTFTLVIAPGHNLNTARSGHTATMLDSAHVLILGGSNATSLNSEELYTPPFDPQGTVNATSSEASDVIAGNPCALALNGTGATKCTVTDTPAQVDTNPHTITGNYQPASDYVHSASSGTKDLTVTKADTTTVVTSSVNPSKFGQGVTFTATVTAVGSVTANLAGTLQFYDGVAPIGGPIPVSGAGTGTAMYSPASLTVGTHPITATYSGNTNYKTSTSPGLDQVVEKSDTSTALISSQNPSVFGQSVTFTATVTAVPPGSGTPTGTVTFYDGTTSLGTGTLNGSGQATFLTANLSVASHPITAKFGGDGNFRYSTSPVLSQVVNKADTTTVATSSANPSKFGQSATLTAIVSVVSPGAGTPGGTVTFYDGATSLGTVTLNASGQATLSSAALSVGIHSITATYGGDGSFNNSTSPAFSQEVQKADTTTAVVSAPNPSKFGQSVTLTATVAVVAPGAGTPTGTVTFFDGLTNLGTSPLSGNQATFASSALSVGSHPITAKYNGDGNFKYSTSPATNQEVQKADTNTVVSSSANPSKFGQSITLTATVTVLSPGAGTPSGTVTFYDGATSLGTGTLSAGGTATYTTSSLSVATHPITATYGSDTNFNGSTSAILSQDVQKADTATAVISSQNPSTFGQPVTFTATVSVTPPGAGIPTGTVTFYDGVNNIGSFPLNASLQATMTTSTLLAGSHSITAKYSGDTNFKYSTSAVLNQAVNKADTATAGSSSPNPSTYGQPVTLSAAITVVAPGAGSPTGSVTFWEGSINLGSGTVSASGATLTISTLTAGTHSITANYNGDSNFNISVSPAFNQVVQKANTTTVAVSSGTPSKFGQPVTVTATLGVVSPGAGSPTGTVTFYDGAASLGAFTVTLGQASVTTASLAVGSHNITAKYTGDLNFYDSTSPAITQVVQKADTASVVTSTPNASIYGQLVTLAANVSVTPPGAGTPSGTITFLDGATTIGTAPVSGIGTATYSTNAFAVGVHSLTVVYSGDGSFVGSTSAALMQTVDRAPTNTTMTSALNISASAAATFKFTATVASTTIGTPTGTVSFLDGSTLLGSPVTLSGGVAILNNTTLLSGSHVVVAHYNGDFSFLPGDSPTSPAPQPIITGPPSGDIHAVNTLVSFTGTFTDSPSGETHTAAWSFDGTASQLATVVEPIGSTPGSANTSKGFAAAGVYGISLAVNDGVGGIGIVNKVNSDLPAIEVIYDPNGGFVTGGGWITSNPGAYVAFPTLTGKANFGFVSKYQKGATIPTGETEFTFQVGNLNFHSSSYDWLVISGTQAQYKGTGTINGSGNYKFMLTASDGPDGFRMKITDPSITDPVLSVVYDNMKAPGDDSMGNTQLLGGGSIVIHK